MYLRYQAQQVTNMVQIIITLNPDGVNINVTGPLDQKVLCYGLLERAKDVVRDYKPSPIIKPTDLKIIEKEKT